MGTNWKGVRVLCPFYISEDAQSVTCEGMMPRTTLRQKFKKPKDKDFLKTAHCEKAYEGCPIYRMLMGYKYR